MRIKKRINHTNRKKLPKERVDIVLAKDQSSFSASIDLEGIALPSDAEVIVEPYYRHSYMRIPLGTVSKMNAPANVQLVDIDKGGTVAFRVKIVQKKNGEIGKLLASADRIAPRDQEEDENDRETLVRVREKDLGEVPWKLQLDGVDKPELHMNNRIPGAAGLVIHDPAFRSLLLPAILREVLTFVLLEGADDDEDEITWEKKWVEFAENLADEERPTGDESERRVWIDLVVARFSGLHGLGTSLVDHIRGKPE